MFLCVIVLHISGLSLRAQPPSTLQIYRIKKEKQNQPVTPRMKCVSRFLIYSIVFYFFIFHHYFHLIIIYFYFLPSNQRNDTKQQSHIHNNGVLIRSYVNDMSLLHFCVVRIDAKKRFQSTNDDSWLIVQCKQRMKFLYIFRTTFDEYLYGFFVQKSEVIWTFNCKNVPTKRCSGR